MKTTNSFLNKAIEDQIMWRAQLQMWVRKENTAPIGSNEEVYATDMIIALREAEVRFGGYDGNKVSMCSLARTALNVIAETDEEEYEKILEQIGDEDKLQKYIYQEACKLADKWRRRYEG